MRYTLLRDFYNIYFFGGILLWKIKENDRVLEIGCGSNSLMVKSHTVNRAQVVGVDIYQPYIDSHKAQGLYRGCICGDITKMTFNPDSFNVVVCMDVIEHLSKADGKELLLNMQKWGEKVIITTPNGAVYNSISDNPHQKHISSWSADELELYGYKVRGLSGWKALRTEKAELRYKFPYLMWAGISLASQAVAYFMPEQAYHLLATYDRTLQWKPND